MSADNKVCKHCYISGLVQGVWFRDSTRRQAQAHHVTGWVRNLADGRVEVFACAEPTVLEKFLSWLYQGPSKAIVDKLVSESVDWQHHDTFKIR